MTINLSALFVGVQAGEEEEQFLYEALIRAENAANNIVSGAIVGQKRCMLRLHFKEPTEV